MPTAVIELPSVSVRSQSVPQEPVAVPSPFSKSHIATTPTALVQSTGFEGATVVLVVVEVVDSVVDVLDSVVDVVEVVDSVVLVVETVELVVDVVEVVLVDVDVVEVVVSLVLVLEVVELVDVVEVLLVDVEIVDVVVVGHAVVRGTQRRTKVSASVRGRVPFCALAVM